MSRNSPGGKLARGGTVTLIGQAIKIGLQFLSLVLLSRLLTPSELGIFSVVTSIVGLGELLRDFGIVNSAMSQRSISHQQFSNLFWITGAIGAVLTILAVVVAAFLATDLSTYVRAISPVFMLNGLQTVFLVRLARAQRFLTITVTDCAAQTIGLSVAVFGATQGLGVWALVLQVLVTSSLLLLTRALASRWTPSWLNDMKGTSQILRNGLTIGLAQSLTYAANNTANFALQSISGPTSVGLFSRAFQLLTAPINQVLTPITNVILPALTKARDHQASYISLVSRVQFSLALICISILGTFIAAPASVISVLLGDQWLQSSEILRALAFGGMFQALAFVCFWMFLSLGLTKELLAYNLVTKPMTVLMVALGAVISPTAAAYGYSISLLLSWPICIIWIIRRSGFDLGPIWKEGLVVSVAGFAGALSGMLVVEAVDLSSISEIILGFISTSIILMLLLLLNTSTRNRSQEVMRTVRSILVR